MNVLVPTRLDDRELEELSALLARCERADGHPALAEPQRAAASRHDLGGHGAQALLAYDGESLIGCAFITPAIDGATAFHVAVDPSRRTVGKVRTHLLQAALLQTSGRPVRLWLMQAGDADDAEAAALGFAPERDLVQMRIALPLSPEMVASARPVKTRPFRPGQDDDAWLSVNNRAFAGHPEQGGWTHDDLQERIQADWFDPEGFLMADRPDGKGLLGSCWVKIHHGSEPVVGEIYVISIDPDVQGAGWGRALTVAGLQWMTEQGVTVGMLYTTASNTAAMALYLDLGFTVEHVDRSYILTA